MTSVIFDDVTSLYGEGHDNTVIYLQNSTDRIHIENHMTPFLNNVKSLHNVLLMCEFFSSHLGHDYPKPLWLRWVNAALSAASTSVDSIIRAFQTVSLGDGEPPAQVKGVMTDMQITDRLVASARKDISKEGTDVC